MAGIYTGAGDGGETSLPSGSRTSKDDPRIDLIGALDEANCFIGLSRPTLIDNELDEVLEFVQQRLFNCGSALTGPSPANPPQISQDDVTALERAIDRWSAHVGGFDGFTLPGCDEASARLHVARAVVRRAERAAVKVGATQPIEPTIRAFLNRASDLLYVAARYVGAGNECRWRPDAPAPR